MNSNLAIPTDNPFKFLAIFGLVLFLAGPLFVIASTNATNNIIFETRAAAYEASAFELPYQTSLIADLERKAEIAVSDHDLFIRLAGGSSAVGFFMMLLGFSVWFKKIYPEEEDLRKKHAQKLKIEIKLLNKNFRRHRYPGR
jgi:hypothetical protein